ncbi:MAG: hypothetical protein JGK17_11995 [Microcoleus sp. PH2017_10_PVI_O_A]|uniref:hypothetical protein n=1 Tax=unclassified Microcoleus TaxID=2642155 RepID=UPI001DB1C6F6|nr:MULTISPECIES: hypothetical protein [unclassified Microcoleus]MCC3406290.1 hypothetical protein [Microcoleus sp. PH2017_10_PVI_O_A]MCC3460273.1 hypothetical protein [Microcoleus sp. PH2017_11_PCY_U_A]MCC3478807.1 hypothetical protein [Microcoleus sp. PH2017_12_PCY_D_A]MCC3559741.1 hypothetical protein [Microcoleus sp. PH2017_27_LUM_O_A]
MALGDLRWAGCFYALLSSHNLKLTLANLTVPPQKPGFWEKSWFSSEVSAKKPGF